MPTLLWLRRDLRLHDLPPLLDATAPDGDVLACYVLDPRLKASSGPRRLQYLYDALRDLHANLDGRLMVTRGQPHKRIPLLAKEIGATSVHVSADYSTFGRRRDGAVREALGDVPLEEAGSPYLVSPGRVTKRDGTPYKVFTLFMTRGTGFPIVDAEMRQLAATGFMHNRVRMIVASFLVKDLHLPWQWGARWFLEQLVDGDMASNQHGWQWAAGCGTDAAPTSGCSTPLRRARSSTQTVPTSAGGCPRLTTTTIPRRSSTMPRNAKRRYAATASSADRYFLTPSPASTGSVTPVTYRPE
jgi:deoxyribodipyrimidine photolyase